MGKSYQKYNAQKEGKDRYFPRKSKKQCKVSMHGAHCNKKTCTACKRHNIRDCNFSKKYCPSKTKNFLNECHPKMIRSGGGEKAEVTYSECCICYEEVKNYGYNQIQCGPRNIVKTVCHECKVKHWEQGNDDCPMCRSHPIQISEWAANGCKKW